MDPVFFIKSTKIGVFYKMDPVFSRDGYPEIRKNRDPCPAFVFIIPLIGWGTAGDMTVSLSGAGVEGVVVKVAIGDGSWREV